MLRSGWMVPAALIVSVILLGGAVFAATMHRPGSASRPWAYGLGRSSSYGGMMGGYGATSGVSGRGAYGGMMGGADGFGGSGHGANRSLDSYGQVGGLVKAGEAGAIVNRRTDTVAYRGKAVNIVALASPHGEPDMTWEIGGLVNPTIVVQAGSRVQVTLVNTDRGYMHGFEVTSTPPPYSFMAMMNVNADFLLMPLPERTAQSVTAARYYTLRGQLDLRPGVYHYLCPVPGHARMGMRGTLKIV